MIHISFLLRVNFVSDALKLEATTGKPRLPAFTCDHMM